MEQKEPSMEEILSSIRRILSNEETAETKGSSEVPMPEMMEPSELEDIEAPLELTPAMMIENPNENEDDMQTKEISQNDTLLSDEAEARSTQSLSELAQVISEEKETPASETSLEGLVKSILTPYLKEWLDMHLPSVIERVVQKEVRRLIDKAEL